MAFLEIDNIEKSFGGVHALCNVSFSIDRGEIHGICGENGAGKSTLIKILSGVYPSGSHEGYISLSGIRQIFNRIQDAEKAGIAVIHQELSLVKHMTVAENIFLGREPGRFGIIHYSEIHARSKQLLNQLGLNIDPETEVVNLGIGEQQLVEIAKAISKDASILILDEPTTALTEQEVKRLMSILREMKQQGVTMIYISHKLNEVMTLCDRITVLRDGSCVTTQKISEVTERSLVSFMVGREITDFYPHVNPTIGDTILTVDHLTVYDPEITDRKKTDSITFEVRQGEILGISGLMGAGRTELLMGIFGAWKGKITGNLIYRGKSLLFKSPVEAISSGIALVTEDRKRFGLIPDASVGKNLNLASLRSIAINGILSFQKELRRNSEAIKSIGIKVKSPDYPVNTLSGGNQQKVVLGKWLLTNPDVLFLDEPTRGIDVGAKSEIYGLMNYLIDKGMAIVMVSSDLPEILGMSHRILVLHEGKITAEFKGGSTSEEVMMAATGQINNTRGT